MVLNYLWIAFFLIAFVVALIRTLGYILQEQLNLSFGVTFDSADMYVFSDIVDSTFTMAETSIDIAIYLIGIMTLWLGIMKIGEKGGAIDAISKVVTPLFNKLFPSIPNNHPAMGSMIMNLSANMLGLDNAATPLGLKAMKELQALNPKKETASDPQIMFLVLNTSGLTIIPVSIMALRAASGAANPADIFIPIMLTTFFSTLAGLISVSIYQKINLFQPVILIFLGGLTAFIGLVIFLLSLLTQSEIGLVSELGGKFILFLIIVLFIWLGTRKKINLYETFIDGAEDGFKVAISIIPYLVAMLVAIGVFRASGAMSIVVGAIGEFIGIFGINTDFVGSLPTAFMKPLSGSGARGMMVEAFEFYGVDSFQGRLAATFQGSTETTFYTLAVYFGAVNVRNSRYTVTCGLIADFTAIIAGIFIGYLFFH